MLQYSTVSYWIRGVEDSAKLNFELSIQIPYLYEIEDKFKNVEHVNVYREKQI